MKLLPVALNVAHKRCLVVGGGSVAHRKAQSLIECDAALTVLSPALSDGLTTLQSHFHYVPRCFEAGDSLGYHLVFACTDQAAVNAAVAREAQAAGIWCNLADDATGSDFHSMATVRQGDICIGLSTTGHSPALTRHLKAQIAAAIGPEYQQLAEIMGARRAALVSQLGHQAERAALWRAVLESEALALLQGGDRAGAETLVDKLLNSELAKSQSRHQDDKD